MSIEALLNNKSNTHQVLWISIGSLSVYALGIVSAAILSRYFQKSEYGTYRQVLYVYTTLQVIFTAGLPRVISYYLPRYPLAQGRDIVRKVTLVLFVAGILFSAFLYAFSGVISEVLKNPQLSQGLKYFSPVPLLLLPTLGVEGILATYKKSVFIALYNVITRLLSLLCIILPVILLSGTYIHAIYGWVAASFLTLVVAYFFIDIPFKGVKTVTSRLQVNEILNYSFPLAISSIAGIAIKSADQFYISSYFGRETFAEFSNGFIQLPIALMITNAVSTVLMPIYSKMVYDKADLNQLGLLWKESTIKSAMLIYPMVIFFMVYSKEIMVLLYSSKYKESSVFFIISMAINFFNVISFYPVLFALGETKFYARLHMWFAVSAWVFGYFVTIIFNSPVAIALFSSIQSIGIIFFSILFARKRLNIDFLVIFPVGRLAIIGAHSLFAIIFVEILTGSFPSELPVWLIMFISFTVFVMFLLILSPLFRIKYRKIFKPLFG